MSEFWQLKPDVALLTATEREVVFGWLGQRIRLKTTVAREIPLVVETLRTPQTVESLCSRLGSLWTPSTVAKLLETLSSKALLVVSGNHKNSEESYTVQSAFGRKWQKPAHRFPVPGHVINQALRRLDNLQIKLITRIGMLLSGERKLLSECDVRVEALERFDFRSAEGNQIHLVVSAFSDLQALELLHKQAVAKGAHILPVLVDPFGAVVGPLLGGPGRPCLGCLATRIDSPGVAPQSAEFYATVCDGWPETYWQRLNSIIEDELFKLVSCLVYSPLQRGAFRFDFVNHRSEYDEFFPVPGCVCNSGFDPLVLN